MPRGVSRYDEAQLQGRLWTPRLIPSLIAWWDANQGITAPSGLVTQWVDVVSGIPATASTTQPTFSTTARNGRPGLIFPGGKYLTFTPTSAFPVGAAPGTITVSGYANTTGNANNGVFSYGAGANLNWRALGLASNSNNVYISFYGSDLSTSPVWAGLDHLVIWTINGTASGVSADGAVFSYTSSTPNTTLAQGAIGRYNFGGQGTFSGTVQQVVLFSSALTFVEMQKLQGWESHYNGKAGLNLAASHPFRNRPPLIGD